jgi:hypothetical protein
MSSTSQPSAIDSQKPRSGFLFISAKLDVAIKHLIRIRHPIKVASCRIATHQRLQIHRILVIPQAPITTGEQFQDREPR